jgi:predicted O-linked N-acetylglucosamine transferase (SPINDLY family)
MPSVSEALSIAMAHHQAGRLDLAEEVYRRILAAEPGHAEAWHLLGVVAQQRGLHQEAVECVNRAIEADQGKAYFYNTLGEAYRALGKAAEAVDCYRRAVAVGPERAEYHHNLALALQTLGQRDRAAASFRRVLSLKPDFVEALNNLGNLLRDQGELDEAVDCYRRAIQLGPGLAGVHCNLGVAFHDQGKLPEAIACYQRALELDPDLADAHYRLGNACKDQGQLASAAACYRHALERNPNHVGALNNLGAALRRLEHPDEAIACCRRALDLAPDLAEAYGNLGNALKDQGRLDEAVACCRRAVELMPGSAAAHSNLVYTLHFLPNCEPATLAEEHRRWNRVHAQPLAGSLGPPSNDRSPERRLRVGYVSPHLCAHVVGRNVLPLVREHDRRAVEVFCYADVPAPDAISERLRSHADAWRSIAARTDDQVAEQIRSDRIDILVDLALHLEGNRLLVFVRRPAPVQVTFAGYPGTTGLTAIDYRLSDPYLDPPDVDQRGYAEESIRLGHSFWCYDPQAEEPAVNRLPALERGFLTFGCLNDSCKVNEPVLKLWAQVLRAVERSRLALLAAKGTHRQRTLDLLAAEGVSADRVIFFASRPHDEYLQLYHGIDLGLDTFPYNGHTTSLDALWMGVPVVTIVGRSAVGRAGLSQLTNLGLAELAAEGEERFVDIATALAQDLPRLAELRATLRQRMQQSPLMDAPRFARDVETVYRTMWRRWCEAPRTSAEATINL